MPKGYTAHSKKLESGKYASLIRLTVNTPSFPDGVCVDRIVAENGRIMLNTRKPAEHDTALQAVNAGRGLMRDPEFVEMIG